MNDLDFTPIYEEYISSTKKPSLKELAERYMVDLDTLFSVSKEADWEKDRREYVTAQSGIQRANAIENLSKNKISVNNLVNETLAQMVLSLQVDLPSIQAVLSSRIPDMANKDLIAYMKVLQGYQELFLKLAAEAAKEGTNNDVDVTDIINSALNKDSSVEDVMKLHTDINSLTNVSQDDDAKELFDKLDETR
jgi:hypothetical protein